MITKYKNLINSLIAHRLTSQVRELYLSTLILGFAVSAVNIFEPVFLYLIFISRYGLTETLRFILFFYLAVYVIYFFCIPLGAKFAKRFGYEHSIAVSSVFTIFYYLALFGISKSFWLIMPAVIFYVLSKMFYWPAYHSDFARYSSDGERGREICNLNVLISVVYIFGPIIGGFLIKFYGFGILFFFASVLILLSNAPMLITKEKFTPTAFAYKEAFKNLFDKQKRKYFLAHLGFGEELIALVIWPIFIFVVLNDFFALGVLAAISTAVTMFIFLYIGRLADKSNRRFLIRYGAIFYFFSWLFRLLSRSIFGVFLIDAYARVAKQAIATPVTTKTYEKAQDGSVMSAVTFFEMSLVLGKIIAMVVALVLLQFFVPGWNAMFILAGLMTLFYLLF